MTLTIRAAAPDDLAAIQALRRDRTAWLADRGSDQWSDQVGGLSIAEFTERITAGIAAHQTWIAELDGQLVATITIDDQADPDLWTPAELGTAAIIHYMIVDRRFAGRGVGQALLAHADQVAANLGRAWLRLDAWTTNTGLHAYYRQAGFQLARIADPRLPSAALFERQVRCADSACADTNSGGPDI